MPQIFNRIACMLIVLISTQYATAEDTSKSLAQKSALVWSAFECSALATRIENKDEAERLLKVGHNHGTQFFIALNKHLINDDDLHKYALPIIVSRAAGPSIDFVLGRIYESATSSARDSYVKELPINHYNEFEKVLELQKLNAVSEFSKRNCKFIGVNQ